MTTSAKSTYGARLQYGDGASPEKFTSLAEITNITCPEEMAEALNATSHDSSGVAEYVPAELVDSGEFSMACNRLADTTQGVARSDLASAARNWQLAFVDFGAQTQNFTTDYITDSRLDITTHGLTTGQAIQVSSSGTLPGGLSASTTYWARWVSADEITLHTSEAGAIAGSGAVTLTSNGTGTHSTSEGTRLDFAGLVTSHNWNDAPGQTPAASTIDVTAKITGAITVTP